MKAKEKAEAIKLRKSGLSVRQIAGVLDVSQGSVHLWTNNIELSEEDKKRLACRGNKNAVPIIKEKAMRKRELYQESGKLMAKCMDPLHIMGTMLYWGEGTKSRNVIEFTNSDPNMMKLFVDFLQSCLKIGSKDIFVTVNCHAETEEAVASAEEFWLKVTKVPRKNLKKTQINKSSKCSKKKRGNTLPFGTCRIRVYNTELVQGIYGAIQEYGGFKNEQWLQ